MDAELDLNRDGVEEIAATLAAADPDGVSGGGDPQAGATPRSGRPGWPRIVNPAAAGREKRQPT
jgi:hypothetical protein